MKLRNAELMQKYDEMLDECCEPVKIGSLEYSPSLVLFKVDRIAYDCGFNDWLDDELSNGTLFEKDGEYFDDE